VATRRSGACSALLAGRDDECRLPLRALCDEQPAACVSPDERLAELETDGTTVGIAATARAAAESCAPLAHGTSTGCAWVIAEVHCRRIQPGFTCAREASSRADRGP
jgi:hypothetical protein